MSAQMSQIIKDNLRLKNSRAKAVRLAMDLGHYYTFINVACTYITKSVDFLTHQKSSLDDMHIVVLVLRLMK